MESKVTVCLTSCGRPDLLEFTLYTFFKFNSHSIDRFLIYEDEKMSLKKTSEVCRRYPVELLPHKGRLGQIRAVDLLYSLVNTAYIFHMEDDWGFYRTGFIEDSIKVLKSDNNICCVWIRNESDVNGHGFDSKRINIADIEYSILDLNYKEIWHGFTFNPSLRRLSDYKRVGLYSLITGFDVKVPWLSEAKIGLRYKNAGYRAAIIRGNGYVSHNGEYRGIRQ